MWARRFIINGSLAALSLSLIINIPAGDAYNFSVANNAPVSSPGGSRYAKEIGGKNYSLVAMSKAADCVVSVFGLLGELKPVQNISLIIEEDITTTGIHNQTWAYVSNASNIHVSARYLGGYKGADVKKEFTGIIYHSMARVLPWDGKGQAPVGLLTGLASFVRTYADLAPAESTVQFGDGDRWDQGYEVTANFLIYCESLREKFVPELNLKMKDGYSNDFFYHLIGKTVDQLWKVYKTEFGQSY
ncbi:unnamed protein product [Linum tenue]|uniref:Uncharacterized protein n=1 Tax=Linum tenue TaxID=586396 RepID=A0AAV0MFU5_9ROSI|nr:unnamed protein product [Linum tenue]